MPKRRPLPVLVTALVPLGGPNPSDPNPSDPNPSDPILRDMEPELTGLRLHGALSAWTNLGFATSETSDASDAGQPGFDLGGVRLTVAPPPGTGDTTRTGIAAWSFAGDAVTSAVPDGMLDGLAVDAAVPEPPASPAHPNGIGSIDHVVVMTPNLERTIAALGSAGLNHRRRRDVPLGDQPGQQVFFVLGTCVLELVGPVEPSGDGPATFWGLALTAPDLDATVAFLGDRTSEPKTAVQPGRRITTIDRAAGLGVPVAVLSARS